MLTKLTGCRTSISKTFDIHGGAISGPQRHNLNELGKGSLENATNNIKALFRQKYFLCFPYISLFFFYPLEGTLLAQGA